MPYPYSSDNTPMTPQAVLVGAASISAGQGLFVVSTINPGSGTNAISANQQLSAQLLGGTAFIGDVSALSPDAGLFRVSSIGATGTSNDILIDGRNNTVSATIIAQNSLLSSIATSARDSLFSRIYSLEADQVMVSAKSQDAGLNLVSAKQGDAGALHSSSYSGDSNQFHVSTLGAYLPGNKLSSYGSFVNVAAGIDTNGIIRAIETDNTGNIQIGGDAGVQHVSAINQDANFMHVSGFSPDAGLFKVSSAAYGSTTALTDQSSNTVTTLTGANTNTEYPAYLHLMNSAATWDRARTIAPSGVGLGVLQVGQWDASILNVSAKSQDANNVHVSAVQGDAGLLHTSSYLSVATTNTGGSSFFSTSAGIASVSTVKSTAGRLYGYHLGNPAGVDQYLQVFNASGGATLGTDVPALTLYIPTLGGAVMSLGDGIGFSNGIQVAVTSTAGGSTAGASAMRINVFYA